MPFNVRPYPPVMAEVVQEMVPATVAFDALTHALHLLLRTVRMKARLSCMTSMRSHWQRARLAACKGDIPVYDTLDSSLKSVHAWPQAVYAAAMGIRSVEANCTLSPAGNHGALQDVVVVRHSLELLVVPRQLLARTPHRDQRQVVSPEFAPAAT